MRLIGLTGKARSGKDTVAGILRDHAGYQRIAFADPLKNGARELFGLSPSWMHESSKEEMHPYWRMTPRRMFQLLGTEAMRNAFGPDFWVHRAFLEVERLQGIQGLNGKFEAAIVITDVRFDNEAEAVKRRGGVVIRVVRPAHDGALSGAAAAHASEVPVRDDLVDFVIENAGSMQQLTEKALNVLDAIEGVRS